MRLTHVKLAGFKSFVDPTSIPVPGQLVAVVGPNGCGKSNVIDAVRWVLGESSAKQLRGESMQDVIFNGSNSRKPVGRASVELVFDNAEGRAAGQWSQFTEISIKRLLTRQGESSYFINNLQCRRRDIADLFLGTGVGTRGYAVIEQGMISRIIEARPEELRAFLEEAAGVTKYKDRRRETESRIADTRDNLARVDDIRRELTAQLEKLQSQAEVAEKFNTMKAAVVEKQNLLALQRKRDAERESARFRQEILNAENALESQTTRLRETESQIELLREANYEASDRVQTAQTHLADAAATVARMEQKLVHLRENRLRLQNQINDAKSRLESLDKQATEIRNEQEEWTFKLEEGAFAYENAQALLLESQQSVPDLDAAAAAAEETMEEAQLAFSHARQTRQLAEQQAQHLERSLQQLRSRRERLDIELRALPDVDEGRLDEKRLDLEALSLSLEGVQDELHQHEAKIVALEQKRKGYRERVDQLRSQRIELNARIDALERLQEQVGNDAKLKDWLSKYRLHDADRVFRHLKIENGWERAFESVLREKMSALIVDSLVSEPSPIRQVIVRGGVKAAGSNPSGLRKKVHCEHPAVNAALDDWLARIDICTDEELNGLAAVLPEGELLVSSSGHLGSRTSIQFFSPDGILAGVLQREQDLTQASAALDQLEPLFADQSAALELTDRELGETHSALRHIRLRVESLRAQRGERQVEVARMSQMAEQALQRRSTLQRDIDELQIEIEETVLEAEAVKAEASDAAMQLPALEERVGTARMARAEAETARDVQRSRLREAERQAQESGFARQSAQARLAEIERRSESLAQQHEEVRLRMDEAAFDLEEINEGEFDVGFQSAVDKRQFYERTLAAARDVFNVTTNALREKELEKTQVEQGFDPLRNQLGDLRLKEQEARLALERFAQELLDAGADEVALMPLIGDGLKVQSLVSEIGKLTQQINQLGAVNLAALEELNSARERAGFLESQAADLNEAMETLESAIRRIDRETRAMLQDTFDRVNSSLQELFPTLFGGGHAELILTGDEILDAGIQIMAQPPGKKNSTIHLLSGGEKALTALSLVFSLFRLNPAPFCLLDEVDAPLDDANTSRFCDMVKRMAERTQFLYISHNKLTMEMADQLVGITMQEQGVSRCVAVDIAEALQMREMHPA